MRPLRALFRRNPPAEQVPPATPAAVPAAVPSGPDPFDGPWALLSGEAEPQADVLTEEQQAQVERLSGQVLRHFARTRPAPTAFPALAVRIMDLLNEPDVDMGRLLKAISPEPAISLNVLRVANSALYSRGAEVADMRVAVMRIGLRGVGEIAAGVAARTLFDVALRVEYEIFGQRWNDLFLDTMAVAFGASQFAFEQNVGRADRAFLAGMFHDLGKSVALRSLASMILAGEVPPGPGEPVVDALLERVHVEIGAALHDHWALPPQLREICLHHHDAEVPDDPGSLEIHVIRLAEGVHRLVKDPGDARRLEETRQSIRAMRLERRGVRLLHREMEDHAARVKVLFPA